MPDSLDIDALDPNFAPPTRPPSALSTTSDTSYFALYEEPDGEQHVDQKNPPPEYLPRRIVVETIRRHGWTCLLCARKDDLAVVRAVLQHGGRGSAADQDPIAWLKSLGLLPPTYERDDWTNLMTLCGPHARAYEDNVWRWIPGAKFREQMPGAVSARHASVLENSEDEDGDVTMSDITVEEFTKGLADSLSKVATGSDEGVGVPAETLVDDGISGNTKNPEIHFKPMELPHFDVLVFQPEMMPPVQNAPSNPSAAVWRDWRTLTLNPYVAYASSLPVTWADGSSFRGNGSSLRQILDECLAIRSRHAFVHAPGVSPPAPSSKTGSPNSLRHDEGVTSVVASQDSKLIMTALGDGTIVVWDAEHGTIIQNWLAHRGVVRAVAFPPDSRRLVPAGGIRRKALAIWDISDVVRRVAAPEEHTEAVSGTACVWSPDGASVESASADGTVRTSNPLRFGGQGLLGDANAVSQLHHMQFSPDERHPAWIIPIIFLIQRTTS